MWGITLFNDSLLVYDKVSFGVREGKPVCELKITYSQGMLMLI